MLLPLNNSAPRRTHHFRSLVILLVWFAALGYAASQHQAIFDWWKLRSYQAPAAITQLAQQNTMTDYGRKIFYVNHPLITPKTDFGNYCPTTGGEQTIVLGCYHSGQSGIFLSDVTDPRLNGVEQVTAAHEMLHGAYDRLSGSERTKVNAMLMDYYNHQLSDPRILATMEAYKKSEPKDVVNEMHSIFGTEVANLPAPLEQYYKQYFSNRGQVAGFAAQYQAEFTSRQAFVIQADTKLAALKAQIESLEADLKAQQSSIATAQSNLVAQRNSGNVNAYNAGVPAYNNQVDAYNAEVERIRSLISQYNQLVAERNAIALEENQLLKNLSSNAQTINN